MVDSRSIHGYRHVETATRIQQGIGPVDHFLRPLQMLENFSNGDHIVGGLWLISVAILLEDLYFPAFQTVRLSSS